MYFAEKSITSIISSDKFLNIASWVDAKGSMYEECSKCEKWSKFTWFNFLFQIAALGKSPLAGLAALGLGGLAPTNTGGLNPAGIFEFPLKGWVILD